MPAIPVTTATSRARAPRVKMVRRPQRIENPVPPEVVEEGEVFIAFLRWRDPRLLRVRNATSGRRARSTTPATTTTAMTSEVAISISGKNPSVGLMTLEALGYGCPLLLRYTAPQRSGRYWPRVLPGLATDTL